MFHTLTLTILISTSLASTCYDPSTLYNPYPQKSKREDSQLPDALPIALPPQWLPPPFFPPPWSPDSDLDSPYPSSGVSPWDDSGRSQILDNDPSICPRRHLDCQKCPRDVRCRYLMSGGGGYMDTTTEEPEKDGKENCPVQKCDAAASAKCGEGAKCTRGFCMCELGMKGAGTGVRGTEGLGIVTVYVEPGVECGVKCDDLSCKEVGQLAEGVCYKSGDAGEEEDGHWYDENM